MCEDCYYRKENYVCDACLQDAGGNLPLLGFSVGDFIYDTEVMLQRTRKMFDKVPPQLHNLLREIEKSLILTEEENKAILKKHCLRIFEEIDSEVGRKRFEKIMKEL